MIDFAIMKAAKKLGKKFHMPSDIIFSFHQLYNTVKTIPIRLSIVDISKPYSNFSCAVYFVTMLNVL